MKHACGSWGAVGVGGGGGGGGGVEVEVEVLQIFRWVISGGKCSLRSHTEPIPGSVSLC